MFMDDVIRQEEAEEGEIGVITDEALLQDDVRPHDECRLYDDQGAWAPLWFRLVLALAKWVAIGAPTYIITMIRYGAFVPLLSIPPAFFVASPPIVGE